MEITGSKQKGGTKKDPKFDLLSWFKGHKIPVLEELCRRKVETMTELFAIKWMALDHIGIP